MRNPHKEVYERPQHISDVYKATNKSKIQNMRDTIALLPTGKLLEILPKVIEKDMRIGTLILNQELTKRGYPPCLRNLNGLTEKNYEHPDRQVIDLDWIANSYPENERKAYGFFKRIFNTYAFMDTAKAIWKNDMRAMWKIVAGLELTPKQQWSCHYICSQTIRKQKATLDKNREEVIKALRDAKYSRGLTILSEEERAFHDRLVAIWDVAHIGGWKPTAVANLYTLKTGKTLSRQMCSKLLGKLDRDAWKFVLNVSH